MSQCKAQFCRRRGMGPIYYCMRDQGHKGDHETYLGERFTEEQAYYRKPNRKPEK